MRETGASISQWAEETFGPAASLASIAARALTEMAELVRKVTAPEPDPAKIVTECADVVIVLARLAHRCGGDIFDCWEPLLTLPKTNYLIGMALNQMAFIQNALLHWEGSEVDKEQTLDMCRMIQINLSAACRTLQTNLRGAVDAKMTINRGREWVLDGTGHGQHVKKAAPEDPWSFGPGDQRCYTKTLIQDACMEPEEEARVIEALRKAGRLWE